MKKSLLNTNLYLKDAAIRERSLVRNIESSSAIEGIWVKRDASSGRFIASKTSSTGKGKRVMRDATTGRFVSTKSGSTPIKAVKKTSR